MVCNYLIIDVDVIVGPSVVKHHMQQLMTLWTSAFPRSSKEFEQEKTKGDSFTWHVTLESRAGALCCKTSLVSISLLLLYSLIPELVQSTWYIKQKETSLLQGFSTKHRALVK